MRRETAAELTAIGMFLIVPAITAGLYLWRAGVGRELNTLDYWLASSAWAVTFGACIFGYRSAMKIVKQLRPDVK
jgi:hypothetical protein